MLLVNIDYIPGRELEPLGLVKGSTIQSKNIGRDITQSFKTLVGGELKSSTEAVVGSQATRTLANYHFTRGFFGVNGITKKTGLTTPDASEAIVKRTAMEQCRERYVLADHSKFGKISAVTFGSFQSATIITDEPQQGFEGSGNIKVV